MRRLVALPCAAVLALVAAGGAAATNECRGLQTCVPVAGPWVVAAPGSEVSYQLACPEKYVVAGLDAELSRRGVEVTFRGNLGAPVNPGVTTSSSVVFFGRLLTQGAAATFRPHIGCIPAQGGGQRFPVVYEPVAPSTPTPPASTQFRISAGVHGYAARCPADRRLIDATHAIGFYTPSPPSPSLLDRISVEQTTTGNVVKLVVRAGALSGVKVVVQLDVECA
ncbi:MAG: hypothetical protein JOY73_00910 [Actinobacteria bacterium]|nr:hypothetical protein [Actinomycetota bacterium]